MAIRTTPTTRSLRSSHAGFPDGGVASRRRRAVDLLIVEDDVYLRQELAEALRELGYAVELAADGAEALDRLARTCIPRCLLVDLWMPGMSGGDLLAVVERHPEWSKIALIVMTGRPTSVVAQTLDQGGVPLLSKPFSIEQLIASIDGLRARRRGSDTPA